MHISKCLKLNFLKRITLIFVTKVAQDLLMLPLLKVMLKKEWLNLNQIEKNTMLTILVFIWEDFL